MSDDSNLRDRSSTTPLLLEQPYSSSEEEEHSSSSDSCKAHGWRHRFTALQERGSNTRTVLGGFLVLLFCGCTLGMALPKNSALPTPWYREASSCIGYTYFLAWSISFYPQVLTNFQRKQTDGLSADFCGLNVLGFACYSIYNVCFYYSTKIQDLYRHKHHDNDVTVQSNDVAFALHALLLSSITLAQIGYYGGIQKLRPSKVIGSVMIGILLTCLGGAVVASLGIFLDWLDYLYLLSFIKVMISLIKYIPQMLLNFRRKSTVGWSIWNVLLDFTGGVLSDVQLVLDCADMGDWTGITGNPAKFGLGFVSISFDIIFMLQHYVFYPEQEALSLTTPLLSEEENDEVEIDPETTV